jgi:hypothetical protein
MGEFKDYVERGMCDVKSMGLIDEMQNFERSENGSLEANCRGKDDRCIAAGLAVMSYNDQVRTLLMQRGLTYDVAHGKQKNTASDPTSRVLSKYLLQLGVIDKPKVEIPGVKYGIPRSKSSANRPRQGR